MDAATAAIDGLLLAGFEDAARNVTDSAAEMASQGNHDDVLSVSEGTLGMCPLWRAVEWPNVCLSVAHSY
jgi:hypothetical protein